jgi:Mrp family chromosome partitioning ATPase
MGEREPLDPRFGRRTHLRRDEGRPVVVPEPAWETGPDRFAQTLPLLPFLASVRRRWLEVAVVVLTVTGGAAWYAGSLPNVYAAQAVVGLFPRPAVSADSIRLVAPSYATYVKGPETIDDVASLAGVDPEALDDALSVMVEGDTANLQIDVEWEDPETAATLANELAARAIAFGSSDGSSIVNLQSITSATPTGTPSGPPRRLIEAAAAVAGLGFGVAVALALERVRPKLRDAAALERLLGAPAVGHVPRSEIIRAAPREAFDDTGVATAFRTLRSNLLPRVTRGSAIVVTSAVTNEGKTTVAALLAEAFARLGRRVLLIGGDADAGDLSDRFGIVGLRPLSDVLRRRTSVRDAATLGWVPGLAVVAGERAGGQEDLVAALFDELLDDARKDFDMIVVDAPAVSDGVQARTMVGLSDAAILVVSRGTSAARLHRAAADLEGLGVRIVGLVANRFGGRS